MRHNSSSLTLFLLGSAASILTVLMINDMESVDKDYFKLLDRYCELSYEVKRLHALIKDAYEQQRLLTVDDVELAKSSVPALAGATKTVMKELTEFNFSERVLECFEELEIYIVAELLVEIKDYHMVNLMEHDLFDAACLDNIFCVLRENKIIDDNNDSLLYLFI